MGRSWSLAAYLALRSGAVAAVSPPLQPRPAGPLVWVHCADPARIAAFVALSDRLAADGERLHMLITLPDVPANAPTGARIILHAAPPDLRVPVAAFLDHWKPDIMLWSQGNFRPVLLSEAAARPGLHGRYLIDAVAAQIDVAGGTWLPWVSRAVLAMFDKVFAVDDEASSRLIRMGMAPASVEVTGPLGTIAGVLPCNERERRDLAQMLGSRPVWLAAAVGAAEIAQVIQAHKVASRSAHRLLLILVPRAPDDGPLVAGAIRDAGLQLACRMEGTEPDKATQVYLADSLAEMGLWYRLSPICFMGGTLSKGTDRRHPFEAAALGSAVLHGPETDPFSAYYLRLARAGASRAVRSGADLGLAVEALLAPDKAAAMAHAAWDVTTAGADVGNRVIDLIRDGLDKAGE